MPQYVLLPQRGLSSTSSVLSASTAGAFLALNADLTAGGAPPADARIRVLDSLHENGAKLVDVADGDVAEVRASHPDMILAPVLFYEPARLKQPRVEIALDPVVLPAAAAAPGIAATTVTKITVVDAVTGAPVAGANVVAFTNFEKRQGLQGETDAAGQVSLDFGFTPVTLQRLYAFPGLVGYWGHLEQNLSVPAVAQVRLTPIDLTFVDSLRHFHPPGALTDGAGVTVGVIDTGVGPHPDIVCTGDADNGEGHGTHVAGIIAARGNPPTGVRGVAPGVTLRSYRVFGKAGGLAANFTIAKAIDQAVQDGCDLINMSLKVDNRDDPSGFLIDPTIQAAIEDARKAGVLPIVAAGNDNRTAVDFPGRDPLCIAVTALGRIGTFPPNTSESGDVMGPPGADPNDFIAAFSNVGPEVDLTGPGVGVISTVPGGYGVMSGTSMACPAVTGAAARLLARHPATLALPRNSVRATEMARLILGAAATLGFHRTFEGAGLIR